MKLLLMRHGQTNYNLQGLCNDDPAVDVHLTQHGIQQARTAAEQLRHEPLEAIIASQLPRARQTAACVNQYHELPVRVDPRLNDIRSGFEGQPVADYFATVGGDRLTRRPAGGESLRDYRSRVLPVLKELQETPWQSALLIAHEETLRVLVASLRDLNDREMLSLNFANCEILEFKLSRFSPG